MPTNKSQHFAPQQYLRQFRHQWRYECPFLSGCVHKHGSNTWRAFHRARNRGL